MSVLPERTSHKMRERVIDTEASLKERKPGEGNGPVGCEASLVSALNDVDEQSEELVPNFGCSIAKQKPRSDA